MIKNQKQLLLVQLGIVITVIILVAGGLSRLPFSSGRHLNIFALLFQPVKSFDAGSSFRSYGEGPPLDFLKYVFWAALLFSLVYAIISPQHRKRLLRTFILVLILVFLLNRLPELQWAKEGSSEPLGAGETLEKIDSGLPDPPPFITDPPDWFIAGINVFLVLLFLGVIWYLWRRLRSPPDTKTLIIQEAETALTELEAGGDLKDVVLQCYARMSQVLRESRNIERRKAMTPREFERHLAEIGLRDEHIQRLTHLFEGVRYGARPSRGRTVLEARACLRAIIKAYGQTS